MLPSFLGVGVPRAGTTWLYRLLISHPRIFLPEARKEIHFFDRYWNRGENWYASFFPEEGEYAAVGEITPQYFYPVECPDRIAAMLPDARLIVLLRNPVDRAYSQFGLRVRMDNLRGSFEEFVEDRPYAVEWGFYSARLNAFRERFGPDRILVLIYEEATRDLAETCSRLGAFLDLDVDGFPHLDERVNTSFVPRFRGAYSVATRLGRKMRNHDMDWVIAGAKRLGFTRIFGKTNTAIPRMAEQTRENLSALYREDVSELEGLLGRNLDLWELG